MAKISIHSLANIFTLSLSQSHSLILALNGKMICENFSTIALARQQIIQCPGIIAKAIDLKVEIPEIWFCFDNKNSFICSHDELTFSAFNICLPPSLNISPYCADNQLSFVDKLKILAQLNMADCHDIVQLHWSFLCVQQLLSAAKMFEVNLTTTQIQACPNITNALSAKIRKSVHYKNQYGTSVQLIDIRFDFSFDNPFDCVGHSKAATVPEEEGEEFGDFYIPTHLYNPKKSAKYTSSSLKTKSKLIPNTTENSNSPSTTSSKSKVILDT